MRKLLRVSVALVVVFLALTTSAMAVGGESGTNSCTIDCGNAVAINPNPVENSTSVGDTEDCCRACLVYCHAEACEAWGGGTYVYCEAS